MQNKPEAADVATDAVLLIETAKQRSLKAQTIADKLCQKHMDEQHKEKCLEFIANAKNAEAELRANRMPLTRKMDEIKASFTSTEKAIKSAADQVARDVNQYVTKLAMEQQAKEQAIRMAADLERRKLEYYDAYLQQFKDSMRTALDSITLENYIDKKDVIANKKFTIKRSHFANFTPKQPDTWIDEVNLQFTKDVEIIRQEILGFLPELKVQLKKGNEIKLSEKVEIKSDIKQQLQATKINELQQLMDLDTTPGNKKYYEIEILKQKGIVDVFHFWYLNDGLQMELSKVGTMSIDRMRKYAEKKALKGEFIESENIKYHERYKA